ncbi:psp operon transcriptional activator [Azospirillum fermentarium]|uniref:phage shock protein operon transcriptional activator n=1 Tax=Azospirillum fermentarium TaxID=1233114 RepID=UPI002227A71F|nr:phage shock protein operon transcriptional activator [Azospirillum fermentarium]MCW2244607.1 psp operon transcriptional activator [Azospirillum fermentarium]
MSSSTPPPLLGHAPAFLAMLDHVSRLAPLERPALVIGERGTGKELVAARLHFLSRRWDRPFVSVNCAALPDTLLDSALFGHEAGAFTGAVRRQLGRFEQADGGTLFLDELATASPMVQEKLLRAVEYGEIERIGGRTQSVDVRIIAATNADLPALAAAGQFRADLLDRLAFDVVTLPPLRARREDILLLAEHFALGMVRDMGRPLFPGFSARAQAALLEHPWPGNVRELRNAVERSVAAAPVVDEAGDPVPVEGIRIDPFESPFRPGGPVPPPPPLPPPSPPPSPPAEAAAEPAGGYSERVAAFEAGLLRDALAANGNNQRRTAAALGLGYHALRNQMRKHGLLPGGGR